MLLFQHQNKGKPPLTSCNVQVYNASGSLLEMMRPASGRFRAVRSQALEEDDPDIYEAASLSKWVWVKNTGNWVIRRF